MSYWWEESGVRFQCRECGACCGGQPGTVWVTPDERARIAAELVVSPAEFRQKYLFRTEGKCSLNECENYDCIFLERNSKRCRIYKVRPLQCRLFPFWPSMLKDKNIWNNYADSCPGMNNGKLYSPDLLRRFLNLASAQQL